MIYFFALISSLFVRFILFFVVLLNFDFFPSTLLSISLL